MSRPALRPWKQPILASMASSNLGPNTVVADQHRLLLSEKKAGVIIATPLFMPPFISPALYLATVTARLNNRKS